MYKDSYDIPGYKFALIRSSRCDLDDIQDCMNSYQNGNIRIFSFENLDGLTVKEINELVGLNYLKFICYYGINDLNFSLNRVLQCSVSNYSYNYSYYNLKYVLDLNDLEVSDKRIDEVIEEKLMEAYPNATFEKRKVFNCFFERYQDRTHEETVNRVYKMNGLIRK